MGFSVDIVNGIEVLKIDNDWLKLAAVPRMGGKILSIYNKPLQKEFLWTNKQLPFQACEPGEEYDPNFLGGIDELLPNDIPETVDGIGYPDHGELWTTALQYEAEKDRVRMYGKLKKSGLLYSKTLHLDPAAPAVYCTYAIVNESGSRRNVLWKLHAALNVSPGDRLLTSARYGRVVDPDYSRFPGTAEFSWPMAGRTDASVVSPADGTMDFFYLYDIPSPEMQLLSGDGRHLFGYSYDAAVFPYQWYFASYGGFLDHYTVILEPCSTMPISLNEAKAGRQCTVLEAGEALHTTVRIFAGEKKDYLPV